MLTGMINMSVRIAYCGFFGAYVVLSLVLSQVAAPMLQNIPWIYNADHTTEWYQINAVLRVSLGNFLFFTVLAVIMKDVKEQRNVQHRSWHYGRWTTKMIIWLLLIILMFFMPNVVVDIYGYMSKCGAGLFLLVQYVLLLDLSYSWNDDWIEDDDLKWYYLLLAVSVGLYIASFTLSTFLFIWFNPPGYSCGLNVFFIVMNLILGVAISLIVLHPQAKGSIFPASVIFLYCTYVCYSGLSSEPHDYVCNGLQNKGKAVSISTLIVGMTTTIISVLYSALRAGSTKALLSSLSSPRAGGPLQFPFNDNRESSLAGYYTDLIFAGWSSLSESEDTENKRDSTTSWYVRLVSLSYLNFHLIFALATMYSAMLFSGWTSSSDSSYLLDVGWSSVWVKICIEWVTAGIFILSHADIEMIHPRYMVA